MLTNETKINFRQSGRIKSGKIVKGIMYDPINKTTSGSIPNKYETILYKNDNPAGFNGSTQRFLSLGEVIPGPGSYESPTGFKRQISPSVSKKGLGNGFVSKTPRAIFKNYMNSGPGPGSYTSKDKSFQVTNHGTNSSFLSSSPRYQQTNNKNSLPGPGDYDSKTWEKENSRIITSVFRSKIQRNEMRSISTGPPVGVYEVDRSILNAKPYKHNGGSSSFMNPIPQTKNYEKEKINKLLGKENPNLDTSFPGPGAYFHPIDDETLLLKRSLLMRPSSMFVEQNTTRFGSSIIPRAKKFSSPGPGTYTQQYHPPEKTLVSGAVFMSETGRRPYGELRSKLGPTFYNPSLIPRKKSFHLRLGREWLQVLIRVEQITQDQPLYKHKNRSKRGIEYAHIRT